MSLILVVGSVIGVVAMIQSNKSNEDEHINSSSSSSSNNNNNNENKDNDNDIFRIIQQTMTSSVTSKVIDTICAPTNYKDVCIQSFEPVSKNTTTTPKDYIMTVIQKNFR